MKTCRKLSLCGCWSCRAGSYLKHKLNFFIPLVFFSACGIEIVFFWNAFFFFFPCFFFFFLIFHVCTVGLFGLCYLFVIMTYVHNAQVISCPDLSLVQIDAVAAGFCRSWNVFLLRVASIWGLRFYRLEFLWVMWKNFMYCCVVWKYHIL